MTLYYMFPLGTLHLSLLNYENIPTDGSGRILISDIGEGNTDSLICHTDDPGTVESSEWYYNSTSPTTDPAVKVDADNNRHWQINRGTTEEGF